ncbi:predicted protein [Uncinocarpus reesii 1704]|uniref:Ribonuclease H2 subunit B n=1 Tax=Uncinocarpus reesii (strain UAMH 1704) TaxID=336963 RepID=C4JYW0_UNCRE|nr:uncharacterized protein UREG_07361 [Uncinocarpus reesii 1704]EEP82496.1 predicted protein [Uncinocarpus reesii 1704]
MRTRSSAATAPATATEVAVTPSNTGKPRGQSKFLILPSDASKDARFALLENPRTGVRGRYYFCPKLGLFELTALTPPASTPRSVLFVESRLEADNDDGDDAQQPEAPGEMQDGIEGSEGDHTVHNGSTSKTAEVIVATPIDAIFFLLPILAPSTTSKSSRRLFQPLDDILDAQEDLSKHLRSFLLDKEFRSKVERRMTAICDTVEAGETMFRLSEEKLVTELLAKAEKMAGAGLPPSMEERFVRRALELPILSISREDSSKTTSTEVSTTNISKNDLDSQSSTTTVSTTATAEASSTSVSSTATPATELSQPPLQNDNAFQTSQITHLLRIRTALQYIQSSYLPPHLSTRVDEILASPSSPKDFTTLTEHLKHLTNLRAEAAASRSMYDNFSRKRGLDDEEAEAAAEKRRKQEEEERKKKAKESRGVRELKKVNTSGMKKLSSFFGKKT